ncbi:dihydroneopterin aldolase family protein [Archaeoglobus neptunius]|uniref:dihydroneopterin aldolase family protein n=1 Tax=Archaeoglobus neptunius TaxID=2798580 RepID=UPI00192820DB|nr:dihydroneopterin aldolase family protein [Archaeoglobus neptunius]
MEAKESEEAAFEAGIKLGALFHQFIGVPVSEKNAEILERAMESCMLLQPYVVEAEVRINREKLRAVSDFGYTSLMPDMLYARVKVKLGDVEASAVLEWREDMKYPLMRLIR